MIGVVVAILLAAAGPACAAGERPPSAEAEIEALIAAVAGMTDAAFIRNGRSYDAGTAAEFLRRKWRRHAAEVRSAEDFIEKIASASSTTGRPYLVRFTDGREQPCGDVLRAELARLRSPS
jgi:hypothetical protein